MVVKGLARLMSPGGRRARLSILIFHRVLSMPDPMFPGEQHLQRFDQTLAWLRRWFQVIPLDDAVQRLQNGTLPSRSAAITFDDGYADNATNAMPLLQRHGLTATFFVASSFLDGGRMWNDTVIEAIRGFDGQALDLSGQGLGVHPVQTPTQRRVAIESLLGQIKYLDPAARTAAVDAIHQSAGSGALPDGLMMTSAQVLQLHEAGMQIGAHTCSHPILARVADETARVEIRDSKTALESLIQRPVGLFAYPNGQPGKDYLAQHVMMAKKAGFVAAVSTAPGVSTAAADMFQLPRFTPWDTEQFRYGLRMVSNLRNAHPNVT